MAFEHVTLAHSDPDGHALSDSLDSPRPVESLERARKLFPRATR